MLCESIAMECGGGDHRTNIVFGGHDDDDG